jgi:integrase
VTLDGQDYLLGEFGSPESHEAYRRILAEWMEKKGRFASRTSLPDITVNELLLAYWKHTSAYYGYDVHPNRGDAGCLRAALRVVKELYGLTLAKDFGPLALKACRRAMIEKDWSRKYINEQVGRIRRAWKWAVSEELVPPGTWEALRSVEGLRHGKSGVREAKKVKPVEISHVEATLPFMLPTVAAMVRVQLLTGCRPAEVCRMRLSDIDRSNPRCWIYRPGKHKTEHHGHDRVILIGPRAQAVIMEFIAIRCPSCGIEGRPPRIGSRDGCLCGPCADRRDEEGVLGIWERTECQALETYLFSPRMAMQEREEDMRARRKSKVQPSQVCRKKPGAKRKARDSYVTGTYANAIARACLTANRAAHEKDTSIPEDEVVVPVWRPNRLRHTRATELRAAAGLDTVKTVLGHSRIETSLIYAEKDLAAAVELVSEIG